MSETTKDAINCTQQTAHEQFVQGQAIAFSFECLANTLAGSVDVIERRLEQNELDKYSRSQMEMLQGFLELARQKADALQICDAAPQQALLF